MKTLSTNGTMPVILRGKAKSILIHVIAMARVALLCARSGCSKRRSIAVPLQRERMQNEVALLREELLLRDARMRRISAQHRPHYTPTERLAILELKAARGWSTEQAAEAFLLSPETIAYWIKMLDEEGPKSLLRMLRPVNKLPDFIRYIVARLKVLCPSMGKVKIAQSLAKAGLMLSASTVGRILKNNNRPKPAVCAAEPESIRTRARRPYHTWNIDLTVVPTSGGFWLSWLPFALPQVWPFCWRLACILDQYSRCVVGFAVFTKQPTALEIRDFLRRAVKNSRCKPKHIITDKGRQFTSKTFRKWCRRKGISLRWLHQLFRNLLCFHT